MRLGDLLDISVLRKLAEANYRASGMPIGIVDATDGSVLVGFGWQDICTMYHRVNPITVQRCRESDDFIKLNLSREKPCEYTCRNGLRDIGVPISAEGQHLATLFLGQFFYEGEAPDRAFFVDQARRFGFDEASYLAALDRVPTFSRAAVENILAYDAALASFISDLAEGALRRRRAEAQAEALARFPEENPDPVLRISPELMLTYANDAARAGLKEVGVGSSSHVPPELAELARRAIAEQRRVAAVIRSGDRFFSATAVAVRDGVNVYAHDITARVAAEEALRRVDRAKDEFLGVLSHELRNPLAPIRNSLYILDHTEPEGQQARRAKEVAARQLAHLTRLVDDLLDVTRIVRGKVELRKGDLDVTELARRTGEDYRALMHERGLHFRLQVPREPLWVDGDETRLAQVIGNLLQNAAKFTPAAGRVTLCVLPRNGAVDIRVSDTGPGIDVELLDEIFAPFFQAKQSLARTEGGLGLGLALVKGLVDLHGGTVHVASAGRGHGAAFTVRLPLLTPAARDARRDPREAPGGRLAKLHVLVIDDNRDAAESLAELIAVLGHEAEVAFDGATALERAHARPPDLVLCDIGLPGMDGYDVARAFRSDGSLGAVRLVAVTGYARPEDRQRAFDAGFADHIAKPPDPEKLHRLLSSGKVRASA